MKPSRELFNIAAYLVAFLLIQTFVRILVGQVYSGPESISLVITITAANLLTILLFVLCRWSPFSRDYLRLRPWATLVWVALLAVGTIIPSMWMLETLGVDMPEETRDMFKEIMKEPWGYLALGILAPIAEEMVFRGALLRSLLNIFNHRYHWLPILLSALIFGAFHGNIPQFIHGALLGLLLGWMYYRTDSIVPGIVFHWVNNSVAYAWENIMPQAADAKLIDLLGSQQNVLLAIGFSLLIFLPSLFQVAIRLRRAK